MMQSLAQDLRFAARTFLRAPGFTVIAVVTIGLGIAANVGVFSFVDAIFLKALPAKDAGRLVRVYGTEPKNDDRFFSYSEYANLRDHATTLSQLVAHYSTAPLYVNANGQNGEVQGAVVSANYFPTLGIAPRVGRFFAPQEDSAPDRDAVAVIGSGLWRRWFGSDPDIVGKTMRINSRTFQIVGVAPEDFRGVNVGISANELWIPAMMLGVGYRWCDAFQNGCTTLEIMGRLQDGASAQQASAELAALTGRYAASHPGADVSQGAWAMPATGARIGQQRNMGQIAKLLTLAASALLLIACINLAGLLIARGATRTKEIAMRLSLGAARRRIVQQLLTESFLLASLGGVVGVVLSMWVGQMLAGFYTVDEEGYRSFLDVNPDPRTIAYAVALSLLTGVLFGILPAFQTSRQDSAPALKADIASGSHRSLARTMLVACQIALALTLLVGAGLVARSVAYVEGGGVFDPRHVVLLRLRPRLVGYPPEQAQAFQRRVVSALVSLPGVSSVSLGATGSVWKQGNRIVISLPGEAPTTGNRVRAVSHQEIGPRLFETLRVPLTQGRDFDDRDRLGAPRVAIVSESLAYSIWRDGGALDRTILVDRQPHRVVGVVKDYQLLSGDEAVAPMLYVPYWQNPDQTDARYCIRVSGDAEAALPRIRAAIASVDPNVPITEAMPMTEQVSGTFVNARLARSVLLGASGLALLLGAIGLYGALAFMVGRRTREIGIRMAIGARPRQVLSHFLKQGLRLALIGGAAGVLLALAATRLLASFLYGVRAWDPLSFLSGVAILVAVAALAAYLPSRRASILDPMVALRHE